MDDRAPGRHTRIPDPYDAWIENRQQILGFFEVRHTVIYHSMAAVLESLRTFIAKHCPTAT